ncbi:MAG: diacylglycerol kinase family protein [Kofleriaceae bacterium]
MRAVAIVNANARRVGSRLHRSLERVLPGDVRLTTSLDHAREVIRAEIARGCDLIVLGGGDGTVVMGLTLIGEACRGTDRPEPAIGVLRLGSGNAFADTVGATDDPAADLQRLVTGASTWRRVPLIEVLGVSAPFVGLGIDAQVLEDNAAIGRVVDRIPGGKRFVGGVARYVLSVGLRTIPRVAASGGARPNATVTNLGAPALEMTKLGPSGREIPSNTIMWKGAMTLVAGSTIPFFGFGLKMFAFAETHAGRFQLRCGDVGLAEMLRSVPAVFRGEYFSDNVQDFLVDRVRIELDTEAAIEAGGELLGRRRMVEFGLGRPATFATLPRDPR